MLALGSLIAGIGTFVAALGAWRKSKKAASELSPNHGSSLKDSVSRIENSLAQLASMVQAQGSMQRSQGHQIGEIRRDAAQTHELLSDGLREVQRRVNRIEDNTSRREGGDGS